MTTELNDKTIVACNPLGIGRTVPGKCVHEALNFIGTGKTVKEYQEHMAEWVANHPTPHMAFPGGGSAMSVLRLLVDRNKKAVVIDKKPLKGKARVKLTTADLKKADEKAKKAAKKRAPKAKKVEEAPVEQTTGE